MAFSYTDIKNALEQASKKTGGKFLSFDASYYQAHYSEVRDAGGALLDDSLKSYTGDPLQHYVEIGAAKGYAPSAHFDAAFYKSQYADLAPFSGADLLVHYALFGAYEGRAPTEILQAFDGARYLRDNSEVAAYVHANLADFHGNETNGAIAHYVLFGASEDRKGYTMSGLDVDNHAPTVSAPQNIAVDAGKPYVFKLTDFPFADVDPNDKLEQVELVSAPSAGSLKLGATTLAAGALVTRAQLDGGQLSYVPAEGVTGQQSFDFRVMDQFNRSDAARLKLDVVSNHAPTTHDVSLTLNKNVLSLVLKASDFPFADVDSGDSLKAIVISTTPDKGVLKLNGALVTSGSNTQVSLQQLNEGKLVFLTPLTGSVWEGLAAFEFKVLDQSDASATGKVQVTVGNVAPTTQAAQVSIEKNQAYTFKTADFPFSDANGDALGGVQVISLPGLGSLKLNGASVTVGQTITPADLTAGKLVYTPDVDYNGLQNFSFQVQDAALNSATAAMTLVVGNRAPTTGAASVSLAEDASYVFKRADFPFTDADGNTLAKLELGSLPVDGQLRLNGVAQVAGAQISVADLDAGKLTYVPAANVNGARSFDFKVWDQQAASSAAKMTLTVIPVNDAPTTAAAKAVTSADTAYVFKAADFPFSDVDGDTLQAVVLGSLPGNGALSLDGAAVTGGTVVTVAQLGAGLLRYTPTKGFNGKTSFDFKVKDAALESGSANFALSVGNQAPVTQDAGLAVPDSAYVFKTVDFPFQDENTSDSLQAIVIGGLPANGILKLDGTALKAGDTVSRAQLDAGKLVYLTVTAFTGQVSFGFQVKDAALSSNSATMTLNVGNQAPVGLPSSVTTKEDTAYPFKQEDFLFHDADAADHLEKIMVTTLPGKGELKFSGAKVTIGQVVARADLDAGKLVYTPAADATDAVTFDFKVGDQSLFSAATSMAVTITPENDAPTTKDQQISTSEDAVYVFKQMNFPFSDVDNNKLNSIVIESVPLAATGQLHLNSEVVKVGSVINANDLGAGKLMFVPVANFNGNADFRFRVQDDALASIDTATMRLVVAAVPDAPTVNPTEIKLSRTQTKTIMLSDFGFADVDGDLLSSIHVNSLPQQGNLKLAGKAILVNQDISAVDINAGKLTYSCDWPGAMSFKFYAADRQGQSTEAEMDFRITTPLELVNKLYNNSISGSDGIDADISADGKYVVFASKANYLIQNPVGNIVYDVYIRDLMSGTTSQLSVAAGGKMNDGASLNPSISDDGMRIAFASDATNLIAGDENGRGDIFYIDWKSGKGISLASESETHIHANGNSYSPYISGDGKFIAFSSSANNLTSGASAEINDLIYLKNLDSGAVTLVTRGIDGKPVNGSSGQASLSADGRVLAFQSSASNLAPADQNGASDVFIYRNGKVELVSTNVDGHAATGYSVYPMLDAAGDMLAFQSTAKDIVPNDAFVGSEIFIKHLDQSAEVERLILTYDKKQPNGSITLHGFSGNGRFVAFSSSASNIVENDKNNIEDMFIYDRDNQSVSLISVTAGGAQADGASREIALSADGTIMVLGSEADNLLVGVNPFSENLFWGTWGG